MRIPFVFIHYLRLCASYVVLARLRFVLASPKFVLARLRFVLASLRFVSASLGTRELPGYQNSQPTHDTHECRKSLRVCRSIVLIVPYAEHEARPLAATPQLQTLISSRQSITSSRRCVLHLSKFVKRSHRERVSKRDFKRIIASMSNWVWLSQSVSRPRRRYYITSVATITKSNEFALPNVRPGHSLREPLLSLIHI